MTIFCCGRRPSGLSGYTGAPPLVLSYASTSRSKFEDRGPDFLCSEDRRTVEIMDITEMTEITEMRGNNRQFVFIREQDELTGEIIVRTKTVKTKFDDEAKKTFVEQYARHGRMGDAARQAGVVVSTVRKHLDSDRQFAEDVSDALEDYKARLLAHHQDLVFNGTKKQKFDKEGNLIEETTEYPVRLIELELKKHDDGYRDKREVKHDVSGGVLLMPATTDSIDDWEKKHGQVIDAEVIED